MRSVGNKNVISTSVRSVGRLHHPPSVKEALVMLLRDDIAHRTVRLVTKDRLPFTELKKSLQDEVGKSIHKETLSRKLHELARLGLIYQKFERSNARYYSYYEAAPIGKQVLKILTRIDKIVTRTETADLSTMPRHAVTPEESPSSAIEDEIVQ